jgi:hypothetical protein
MAGPRTLKKLIVSVVGVASLAAPAVWVTAASAQPQPDPDANGDVHSNCHTGSKFRGAGGEDRVKEHGNGEAGDCAAAPVPPAPPAPPQGPSGAAAAAARGAAPAASAPAVPVQGVPRTAG